MCQGLRCGSHTYHVTFSMIIALRMCCNGCCTCGWGGDRIRGGMLAVMSCAVLAVVLGVVDKVPCWGQAVG